MEEIIRYIITNDTDYVSDSNATKITDKRSGAFEWRSRQSAELVFNNARSRRHGENELQNNFYVKEITYYEVDVTPDITMDIETIKAFVDIVKDCEEHKSALEALVEKYDGMLQDVMHYIEMSELNARDGFKAYKSAKEIRRKRREYKNRLQIANVITSLNIDPEVFTNLFKYFDNPVYKPREITFDEMFK